MIEKSSDVIIIGMGLGAVATARQLLAVGASVTMLPGAGRPRSKHIDGGIVSQTVIESTIGDVDSAPLHIIGDHTIFRRDQLEDWAVSQVAEQVTIINGFEETCALPHDSGKISIMDDTGERSLLANCVVLTEGANPKIGIASRLRTDFEPEDMIHFGRTLMRDVAITEPKTGSYRTSWNMPAWYSIIPQPEGGIVSAVVRIENVMRSGRDGRDVLTDLLSSSFANDLGLTGSYDALGMELVPLRSDRGPGTIAADHLVIGLDANGTIDARSLQRYNATLSSARELGAMLVSEWPNLVEWDDIGMSMWDVFTTSRTPYHDDQDTGFIEDGPANRRGLLGRLLNR